MPPERPVVLRRLFLLVALAALTVGLVYGRSLRFPFTRDDVAHLGQVERFARSPVAWGDHFREEFWAQGGRSGLYRPLTALSIQATIHVAGREPLPLRVGNLALLALAAAAVGALALRLGVPFQAALLLTGLVAAHPLLSEAVLEVVSRSETQAALCVLCTALLLASGGGGGAKALLVLMSFGAALLSKEGAFAALPALLALLLRARAIDGGAPRSTRGPLLLLLALAVALLAALALRVRVFGDFVGFAPEETAFVDNPLIDAPFATRLFTGISVLGRHVGQLLWPQSLSVDWSFAAITPLASPRDPWFAAGVATLLLSVAWLVAAWRAGASRRAEWFGLLLAGGSWWLISNISRPVGTVMGERLFTLPAIGLLLALVAALARLVVAPAARKSLFALGGAVVVALGLRSSVRANDWRDGLTLYTAAARVAPASARVECTLAHLLRERGEADAAAPHAQAAIERLPDYGKAHAELGACLAARGAIGAALVHLWLAASARGAGAIEQLQLQTAQRRYLGDARVRADFTRRAQELIVKWGERPLFAALARECERVQRLGS